MGWRHGSVAKERSGKADFGLHDPGERVLWEQRGHDLKKPNIYFSSRRGQEIPVRVQPWVKGRNQDKGTFLHHAWLHLSD